MLRLEDVAVARGGLPVLEGVSCTVPDGAATVLRGPNGAGKTTLLRAVAGLQPVLAGRIEPGPEAVAYAGHLNGVKAAMTVRETLDFWAGMHGGGGVDGAMEAFGLGGLADRMAQHLSAGQARRLGLARLPVTGRPVWVMDEPTVGLDAASVALFAAAVGAHLAGGGSAMIATHVALGLDAAVLDVAEYRAKAPVDGFAAALD